MLTRPAPTLTGAEYSRLTFAYDYQSRRIAKKVERFDAESSQWILTRDLRFV